ncbi:unnamed protein product [Didymodactylos carnosus]|uniref:RNase H type-1 domain-containing protein n=1 Tax=Didymodactylos carnosus TaxID=1234261 RepID=A0A8S2QK64_9BILA|nr:unnamed protein product [Didymodactylos carnosus]CAF4097912.1 unnamed protein product [Didymodactylos carnosus]
MATRFSNSVSLKAAEKGTNYSITLVCCTSYNDKENTGGISIQCLENTQLSTCMTVSDEALQSASLQCVRQAFILARKAGATSVRIAIDSDYIYNVYTKWLENWKKCNYILSSGKRVANLDLILDIDQKCSDIQTQFQLLKQNDVYIITGKRLAKSVYTH